MIELEELTVKFGGVTALDAVSVSFSEPVNGIIGPNGAGKTTIMNVISGFLSCSGHVVCEGENITLLPAHKRSQWGLRRSFQREQIAGDLTVRDNLRVISDSLSMSPMEVAAELEMALEVTGLTAKENQLARTLNTYERRLADIARCLVGKPRLVILDEPAGGLSADETAHLGDLILGIHNLTGATTLVIDHDVDLITRICSETLVLDFGKRIAFDKTEIVLSDPKVQAAYLGIEDIA